MDAKFEWLRKKTNISRRKTADFKDEFIRTEEYHPMKSDDPEAFSEQEVRKMKKLSKRRTILSIPSFRKKTIKLFREDRTQLTPGDVPKDVDSGRDSDSVISGDSKGDCLSIRSSSSSLDSGVGSTTNSSSSLMSRVISDIPDVIREESHGRAPIILDESHGHAPIIREESHGHAQIIREDSRPRGRTPIIHEESHGRVPIIHEESPQRGRAPIASPEDDSLLVDPDDNADNNADDNSADPADVDSENSRQDNSASSFHTLSDSCSCDSCDDSSSDSDLEDRRVRVNDSSGSDSDLESTSRTVTPTSQRSTSTDSDSDLDECSGFFTQDKCFLPAASSRNSIVHKNSVNKGNRVKTNGSVVRKPHGPLVTPLPTYSRSYGQPNSTVKGGSSNFSSNRDSAFKSFTSCSDSMDSLNSSKSGTSRNSLPRNRISYCEAGVIPRPVPKLRRSASERKSRSKLRSPILQVRNQSLNREVLETAAVPIVPDLPSDSSKSLADVEKSMQNTAYWVSNSRYNSDPDDCAPLLKDKADVSEQALCQEIIGIYFGEEDSDSSLSSSCLDNSLEGHDTSSSSSSSSDSACFPHTLETNLDDFTTAVYIPAKASEAHTRKISSAKVTKTKTAVKSRPDRGKPANHGGVKLCCEDKPVPRLSEQEVDNITKLHTLCNGQRIVQYLNMAESPMVHFPPPKRASRIIWNPELEDDTLSHHSPRNTPLKPRSALRQRPKEFTFPFVEDKPSPIVITRIRRSKSMSRAPREWPW